MTEIEILKKIQELKDLCAHYSRQCAHYVGTIRDVNKYRTALNDLKNAQDKLYYFRQLLSETERIK